MFEYIESVGNILFYFCMNGNRILKILVIIRKYNKLSFQNNHGIYSLLKASGTDLF